MDLLSEQRGKIAAVCLSLAVCACGGGGASTPSASTTTVTTPTTTTTAVTGGTPTTTTPSTGTGTTSTTPAVTTPGGSTNTSSTSTTVLTGSGTATTAGVQCSYSYSAFNSSASVKLTSTANWSCGSTARALTANGVPDHDTGSFPNTNNPNTITAQTVSASLPLAPTPTSSATKVGIVGYAFNGVKFDPSTAGTCSVANGATSCSLIGNTGTWNIEALGQTSFNFGVDGSNAHVQPDGAYHYHGMPEGFMLKLAKGAAMTLVGYALDGYPVYARYGYSSAGNAGSALKVLTASYRIKAAADAGRPSTATYPLGAFTQDYEYVAGLGDLDECNGRTGATPEFPNGIYHYVITDGYPYIQRCVKGTVSAGSPPPR
jgi:YHYH protein